MNSLRRTEAVFCSDGIGKLVLQEGDNLNSLFDVLQEWERHLAQLDHVGLRCGHARIKPKI